MKKAYVLEHTYEIGEFEESKLIGIYSSRKLAEQAVERYKELPGFKYYPNDFYISEYEIDKDHWEEGFFKFSTQWDLNTKPPEHICPETFCFLWSESEGRCGETFGACKRAKPNESKVDWYEPCEPELELFELPWFYFIPNSDKLDDARKEEYERESRKLWGD